MGMNFSLDLPNLLLIITGVMNVLLGALIYLKRRESLANQLYTLNIIFITWWVVAMVIFRSAAESLLFWTMVLYVTPTFIASSFLYFSYFFPSGEKRHSYRRLAVLVGLNAAIVVLILTPGLILKGVSHVPGSEPVIEFGPWYVLYAAYISGFFLYGLIILFFKYLHSKDHIERRQLIYLLVGYLIASNLAMATNLILPWLGYYELNWLGQVLTLFMVGPVTYAIYRHNLFNMKVIATEILIFSLWIFMLARTLLEGTSNDVLLDWFLLGGLIVIGILLMRSVHKEVSARERIELLAKDLEKANARLTELDQQKSEFVSIASHQLRAPLTAIKGYASMILEGSFGRLEPKAREAVERVYESTRHLATVVEDLLSVTKIELGGMQFDFRKADLKKLVREVTAELEPNVKKAGLSLAAGDSGKSAYYVKADHEKLRQVVANLIDNAVKYTPKGKISIFLDEDGGRGTVTLSVTDTGLGIPKGLQDRLFEKFSRGDGISKVNTGGSGLGLYVAKEVVKAHGGRIWAESEGEGKGSTFVVELNAFSEEK
ncbi:MAG: ATP-binding protein [bacterium]|nr:ATP-binding protein [bacterium]